jgi:hypothetical protein
MNYETVKKLWLTAAVLTAAIAILPATAGAQTIATYQFGTGAITFGMALPQGTTSGGVQVGSLITQTDVKTRWRDGSVRFAVVSATIQNGGSYPITPAAAASNTFTPTWPNISFELNIGGTTFTASPGAFSANDVWLSGPVVRESRVVSRPSSGGSQHPLLEVVFDIRSYASGAHRIDVTVQNVRDSVAMDKVAITSAALKVNNATVWTHGAVTSYSMTRWRVVQWYGGKEASIVPDFEPAFQAAALPRVLSTVANTTYDLSGANYDVMCGINASGVFLFGEMQPDMGSPGGRGELAPLTFWEASYLVHKTANQRQTVLRNGDLTGCWSMHLSKPDGTMIKLGDPGYDASSWWWDTRTSAGNRPLVPLDIDTGYRGARMGLSSKSDTGALGVPSQYNAEHVPAPMYVPYLISGDRYYVDQAKYWGTKAILTVLPYWVEPDPLNFPGWKRGRQGASGVDRILDEYGMTREFGQPLRVVAYAAWMIPDADSDKRYFIDTVQTNLVHIGAYLDYWVDHKYGGALGSIGGSETPVSWAFTRGGVETGRKTSMWRMHYVAYTVDWITRQADLWTISSSVNTFVDRLVGLVVKMNLQNPGYLTGQSGLSYNYTPIFNTMSGGVFNKWFDTFAEVKQYNETYPYTDGAPGNPEWNPNQPETGYYNVYEHADIQMAIRRGVPGAQEAAARLAQVQGHAADLAARAGFAITYSGERLAPTSAAAPSSPTNVRIGP